MGFTDLLNDAGVTGEFPPLSAPNSFVVAALHEPVRPPSKKPKVPSPADVLLQS